MPYGLKTNDLGTVEETLEKTLALFGCWIKLSRSLSSLWAMWKNSLVEAISVSTREKHPSTPALIPTCLELAFAGSSPAFADYLLPQCHPFFLFSYLSLPLFSCQTPPLLQSPVHCLPHKGSTPNLSLLQNSISLAFRKH